MHHGTIVFGARRESFVILGADRLYHAIGLGPIFEGKIVCHPSIPLAIACAGFHRMPPVDGELVVDLVGQAIAPLGYGADLAAVREALEVRLHDLAWISHKAQAAFVGAKAQCNLTIAMMEGSRTVLASLVLAETTTFGEHPRDVLPVPGHVGDYFTLHHAERADAFLGRSIGDREELARHVRAVIQEGIWADAAHALSTGNAREAGDPIDVVIVDESGAEPCQIA